MPDLSITHIYVGTVLFYQNKYHYFQVIVTSPVLYISTHALLRKPLPHLDHDKQQQQGHKL